MIEVNAAIKPILEELGMIYLDAFSLLKDSAKDIIDVELCEDPDTFGLHLNNKGYETWFQALSPLISRELLKLS